ncbi:Pvc16 family protein [Streptomyces sp. NPDC058268]|uniref:Pvc16 family protein n=1 Tax=Streptomyces sp. NPDC058268 TaxID=3346413 RepID=UPI0036F012E9
MIHKVDEVLKKLISGGALAGSGIDVSFDVPTRDWAARRNAPVVNAYLYDIREDVSLRRRGRTGLRDERDIVVRRRRPPRWFRLAYLVTAVLATMLPHELLPAQQLPGPRGPSGGGRAEAVARRGGRRCPPERSGRSGALWATRTPEVPSHAKAARAPLCVRGPDGRVGSVPAHRVSSRGR